MKEFIGKTDIEGNKIYADSSIVEFEDKSLVWEKEYSKQVTRKHKGFFKYSREKLAYMVCVFDEDLRVVEWCFYYEKELFNIKIIDTIQENKLGLIK